MNLFKKKLATFSALLALLSVSCAAVNAAGIADNAVLGKTSNMDIVRTSSKRMDVNLKGGKAGDVGQVDWSKFNVAKGERVNFGFSGISQTSINRVLGGQKSTILGQLTNSCTAGTCTSNVLSSKVILINPAGVMFGPGSQVDLNSFTVSTHDINGIKNLRNLAQDYIDGEYKTGVLNKFSPISKVPAGQNPDNYVVNGTDKNTGYINFDSNYTSQFLDSDAKNYPQGQTKIELDNAKFAHFNTDADGNLLSTFDEVNPNKSVNIVSDNISYIDSQIRTGNNYNYITEANGVDWRASNSNVRLVSADGITFGYVANGYSNGAHTIAADKKTNVVRNITMDNSGLGDEIAIRSGDVAIKNYSNAAGSDIKIKDTIIRGTKLLNAENGGVVIAADRSYGGEYGNVTIDGANNVVIEHSRLESVNTTARNANNVERSTVSQAGGEIYINAGEKATVKNSILKSASAKDVADKGYTTSGMTRVVANDEATVQGSRIISGNDTQVISYGKKVNIDNSLVRAHNTLENANKEVMFYAPEEINLHNAAVRGNDILAYATDSTGTMAGKINVTSDSNKTSGYESSYVVNGQEKSLLKADNKISLLAKDTKIDNSSLSYKEVKFYNDGMAGENNVTVANNSTFSPITDAGKVSRDIVLETNGNFILDKATIQPATTAVNTAEDTEKINSVPYQVKVNSASANNISVTSTEKDVIVKNKSDINANQDINLTSKKGSVNIDDSKVNAGQDANITAYNTIAFGTGKNITPTADINGGRNVNITSTNGDITGEKTDMPEIEYGNKLTFNAKGDNVFTSADSLKSVNVNYIAGGANKFYTQKDIQFVNSSLEAPENFVESGKDVVLNNLEIKVPTGKDPKDVKTQIFANGNVTTDNVTNEDLTAQGGVFPQSVKTDRTGKGKTVLDVNKTKLAITTETVKDPSNPDNGSITLNVKNADNKDAGLELTAQNVTALDQDPTGGNFKPGYYKSGTQKWDENIAPKEGPEVHLNADDNKVAVSKIITDKLTLDKNDKFIAAPTKLTDAQKEGLPAGTPEAGYIEVRDEGGFNLDDSPEYGDPTNPDDPRNPDGFKYSKDYDSHLVDKKTDEGDWKLVKEEKGPEYTRKEGDDTVTYQDTTKTYEKEDVTTTTTKDKKHTIEFDQDGNPENFILVYDKTKVEKETAKDTKTEVTTEEISRCKPGPIIDYDDYEHDSLINQISIPRQQLEVSRTSRVSDNTVDQSANVMAAAARVDLSNDASANYANDDDDYDFE